MTFIEASATIERYIRLQNDTYYIHLMSDLLFSCYFREGAFLTRIKSGKSLVR